MKRNPAPGGAGRQYILTRKNTRRIGRYYSYPPILNIPVPQVGHFPFNAGFPFFKVTFVAFGSSFFARHFTQYIVAIVCFHLLYAMHSASFLSQYFPQDKFDQYKSECNDECFCKFFSYSERFKFWKKYGNLFRLSER